MAIGKLDAVDVSNRNAAKEIRPDDSGAAANIPAPLRIKARPSRDHFPRLDPEKEFRRIAALTGFDIDPALPFVFDFVKRHSLSLSMLI